MKKLAIIFVGTSLMFACGGKKQNAEGSDSTGAASSIKIDGSSTVYPITEAVAEEFQAANKGIDVTVAVSGTGGGFKKFIRKEIDVTGASRPVKKSEDSALVAGQIEYYEIPVAYDGLAVVVNPQNTWASSITVAELKKIWEPAAQGKIKKWNQIRPEWPNEEIHLFGAGTESGTFEYFTEAINGKSKACRGDYTASEDDNVLVQGIATDKFALGFFGYAYYIENQAKLKVLAIDDQNDANGKGAIALSSETILNASYQPLSRPLFIYVNKNSAERSEVSNFVNFYLMEATTLVAEVGYIPFTKETYAMIQKRFADKKAGSIFLKLETTVGVKIDEMLKTAE